MNSENSLKKEFAVAKTVVWWDINTCPVPPGYNPGRVGPSIEYALKNSGYSGPLTIVAIGNLKETPLQVAALSSTGIRFKHIPSGAIGDTMMMGQMLNSTIDHATDDSVTLDHSPRGTVMLISGRVLETLSSKTFPWLESRGFTVLRAYPEDYKQSFSLEPSKVWLWESLLADSGSAEVTRNQDKCSLSPWFCTICRLATQSYAEFFKHLFCESHASRESYMDNIIRIRKEHALAEERLDFERDQKQSKAKGRLDFVRDHKQSKASFKQNKYNKLKGESTI